MIVFVTAPHTD